MEGSSCWAWFPTSWPWTWISERMGSLKGSDGIWEPIMKNVAVALCSFRTWRRAGVYGEGASSRVRATTFLESGSGT